MHVSLGLDLPFLLWLLRTDPAWCRDSWEFCGLSSGSWEGRRPLTWMEETFAVNYWYQLPVFRFLLESWHWTEPSWALTATEWTHLYIIHCYLMSVQVLAVSAVWVGVTGSAAALCHWSQCSVWLPVAFLLMLILNKLQRADLSIQ